MKPSFAVSIAEEKKVSSKNIFSFQSTHLYSLCMVRWRVIFEINEILIIIIISRKVMVAKLTQNPFEIGQTMYIFV